MVKPDILRQPWLNYRGRNITGCECARYYFKLFLFSYDAYFKYPVPVLVYNGKFDCNVKLLLLLLLLSYQQ